MTTTVGRGAGVVHHLELLAANKTMWTCLQPPQSRNGGSERELYEHSYACFFNPAASTFCRHGVN